MKSLAIIACYNTVEETARVLKAIPEDRDFDVLLVNDGSTDGTGEVVESSPFLSVHHDVNRGCGAAIKTGLRYAIKNGYGAAVLMAGNDKDDPAQIARVLAPILNGEADYVQGSRFLDGGGHDNLPLFRYVMVKVHAQMFRALTGFNGTDALNGFRAFRLSVFEGDGAINIWQDWLEHYELETYAHYCALESDAVRVTEVGVTKSYPKRPPGVKVKYSHIRPVLDWWVILKPLVYLRLGIRK